LEADDLQGFMNENPSQMQEELAEQLGIDRATVSRRLHEMGNRSSENGYRINSPHCQHLNTCISLLAKQRKKDFLCKIVAVTKSGL